MKDLSTNFLGQPIQGHNVHAPLYGIGRCDEIELSTIVQKAGGQLIINQSLAPVLGTNEPRKSIWVQVGYPLCSVGGPSPLG